MTSKSNLKDFNQMFGYKICLYYQHGLQTVRVHTILRFNNYTQRGIGEQ
jgi:hypothetical protein